MLLGSGVTLVADFDIFKLLLSFSVVNTCIYDQIAEFEWGFRARCVWIFFLRRSQCVFCGQIGKFVCGFWLGALRFPFDDVMYVGGKWGFARGWGFGR